MVNGMADGVERDGPGLVVVPDTEVRPSRENAVTIPAKHDERAGREGFPVERKHKPDLLGGAVCFRSASVPVSAQIGLRLFTSVWSRG